MSLPAQGAGYEANPADIQAYDVRTGKVKWVFHTIPLPGEFGYDTWPEGAFKTAGGVHNWSELTVDEESGIVFIPTGTGRFDFYGGNRQGANLFANCIVALDARTGRRLWHHQLVHHDLWDFDLPHAPKLLTLRQNGRNVEVVAQATKKGFVFVFDRKTGEPVFPIEERAGAADRRAGRGELADAAVPDQAAAVRAPVVHRKGHQPVPAAGRARGDAAAAAQRAQRGALHAAEPARLDLDARPQRRRQLGQRAVDPIRGEMYVVAKNMPVMNRLIRSNEEPTAGGALGGGPPSPIITPDEEKKLIAEAKAALAKGPVRYTSPYDFMQSPTNGMTAIGPPWSLLTAYDLNTGEIKWQVPDGGVTPPPGSNVKSRPTPVRTCRGAVRS